MRSARRWAKIIIGGIVTITGIILMPVPGPGGTPVTLAGLAILSTELPWAKRLLDRFKTMLHSNHPLRTNKWLRVGVIAGSISFYALSSFVLYRALNG